MDAKLRSNLGTIARDKQSGASRLALRAILALTAWLRRKPCPAEGEYLEVARVLLATQPSMAPMYRLANEVALAVDKPSPRGLGKNLLEYRRIITEAPNRIGHELRIWLKRHGYGELSTYSHSFTVVCSLIHARSAIELVQCSESRPGNEGKATARDLSRAGIPCSYSVDANLFSQLTRAHTLILGADAILPGWVAAKVGTRALIGRALRLGCPVVIIADTTKFWAEPNFRSGLWDWTFGPGDELWKNPPRGVEIYNLYFELTPYSSRSQLRFLTEQGWMSPAQARAKAGKLEISPRLKVLSRHTP